ncbi:M56 family metallopeptidase [Pedobacter xixiisoli]|uniref:BlaR1 peptidase M56 n=1 Tax=Pedobacter xixiisoli TaxID=1476464 RepID=A0A285ZZ57_9SPHI|nr:M56 family metallopeptidase [Pedobacter xixiisoli]SOD14931.1 BlaR1 peptidase M56 [Pedobacter xixiisoli]
MNWLYYLLEANLYLTAFYLMYKVLLQNSTFYNSNRYFLILSIVVAFTTPLVQLGFLKPQTMVEANAIAYDLPIETVELTKTAQAPILTLEDYIFYGYLLFALLLSVRFIRAIYRIISIYIKGRKRELSGYTLVELSTEHTAFSFFNVLFIHPNMAKNNAVLKHEIIHIQQKHTWDIVLLEFLKICCWFNPIVYLIKKDLTLLHEYIADASTTATISKHEYAMFLIENSMASYSPSLVNQFFNQSILKSRINMLNKEKTANWARLKYLLAVPLGIGLLCASTLSFSKTYGYDVFPAKKGLKEEKTQQKKKTHYPEFRYDDKKNFISLEKRAIIINGKVVADKNKYYGSAEADEVRYLSSSEAIKKYGNKVGSNGAIEIIGNNVVMTLPPPTVAPPTPPRKVNAKLPPPPAIEAPPAVKKLKKLPPPVVKPDEKTASIDLKEEKVLEIEVVPGPNQKDVVVKGHKKTEKDNMEILKKEIEVAQLSLNKKKNVQEIGVVPTQKVKGIKIDQKATKEVIVKGYKSSEKTPTQKVEVLKITPKDTLNKTGAIKKTNNSTKEVTTAKSALERTNNVFNKAWTLYKPKVEENKDDRC